MNCFKIKLFLPLLLFFSVSTKTVDITIKNKKIDEKISFQIGKKQVVVPKGNQGTTLNNINFDDNYTLYANDEPIGTKNLKDSIEIQCPFFNKNIIYALEFEIEKKKKKLVLAAYLIKLIFCKLKGLNERENKKLYTIAFELNGNKGAFFKSNKPPKDKMEQLEIYKKVLELLASKYKDIEALSQEIESLLQRTNADYEKYEKYSKLFYQFENKLQALKKKFDNLKKYNRDILNNINPSENIVEFINIARQTEGELGQQKKLLVDLFKSLPDFNIYRPKKNYLIKDSFLASYLRYHLGDSQTIFSPKEHRLSTFKIDKNPNPWAGIKEIFIKYPDFFIDNCEKYTQIIKDNILTMIKNKYEKNYAIRAIKLIQGRRDKLQKKEGYGVEEISEIRSLLSALGFYKKNLNKDEYKKSKVISVILNKIEQLINEMQSILSSLEKETWELI